MACSISCGWAIREHWDAMSSKQQRSALLGVLHSEAGQFLSMLQICCPTAKHF